MDFRLNEEQQMLPDTVVTSHLPFTPKDLSVCAPTKLKQIKTNNTQLAICDLPLRQMKTYFLRSMNITSPPE
ncbi:hypothetical protein [Marinobacter metalliresistant]|uniref:Uncharacterized protein n=1 Tax=Marinobacter metalliresistant TaxID=2961995 RepID=A0ABZ2VYU5_9GAMM